VCLVASSAKRLSSLFEGNAENAERFQIVSGIDVSFKNFNFL
jgi:hypothetical protein